MRETTLHVGEEPALRYVRDSGGAPRPPREVLDTLAHRPPLIPDPPGPTGFRQDNPRHQGEIGFGDAIGWFSRRGLTVSIPLADNQQYDLIADIDGGLARVQVKTATYRGRYERFTVSLKTAGGNQSFHTVKPFDASASELVFVLTDEGTRYVIPSYRISATTSITLGAKWSAFRATSSNEPSLPLNGD